DARPPRPTGARRSCACPGAGSAAEPGATTRRGARGAPQAAAAGRSSPLQLLGEAACHLCQGRHIGAVRGRKGDAVELLQQLPELTQRSMWPGALDGGNAFRGAQSGPRFGNRPGDRHPEAKRGAGGHGFRLAGGEPARVRYFGFEGNVTGRRLRSRRAAAPACAPPVSRRRWDNAPAIPRARAARTARPTARPARSDRAGRRAPATPRAPRPAVRATPCRRPWAAPAWRPTLLPAAPTTG